MEVEAEIVGGEQDVVVFVGVFGPAAQLDSRTGVGVVGVRRSFNRLRYKREIKLMPPPTD